MSEGKDELGLAQGQVGLAEPTGRWAALFEEEAYSPSAIRFA